jgi:hypothetical protein
MAAIAAWLLKNPLAGLAALLAIVAGVQTLRLSWAQDGVHKEQLAFANFKTELAEETLRVERKAKDTSDTKIQELADEMRSVGLVATQAKTEIRLVQSNGGPCRADPAYLATLNGVRNILAAPAGAGGGAGQARP